MTPMQKRSFADPVSAAAVRTRRDFIQAAAAGSLAAVTAGAAGHADDADGTKPSRIDVHQHILPDFYVRSLHRIGVTSFRGHRFPAWSAATLLDSLDRQQISRVLVCVAGPGVFFGDLGLARELSRALNEYAGALGRRHAQRVGAFATIPLPCTPSAIAESAYALDTLALDGVCLLTSYAGVLPGDPAIDEYLGFLDARRALVLLHPASPNAATFAAEITRALAHLTLTGALERFPNIRYIVAHLSEALPAVAANLGRMDAALRQLGGSRGQRAPRSLCDALTRFHCETPPGSPRRG